MTEAVKLLTGMAAPADDASFSKIDQSSLVIEQFASIMNRSAGNLPGSQPGLAGKESGRADDIFSLGSTAGSVQKDYAKFSQGMRTIAGAKENTPETSDFGQKVSALAQKVEEAVQETMQVSEEEFVQVMEALGFSPIDLLNPQNLIQVVQGIFGSDDVSALLVDANFQMALQEVNGLIQTFQQENGLDAGAFGDLLAQLSEQIDRLEEVVEEILQTGEAAPGQVIEQPEQLLQEEGIPQEVVREDADAPKEAGEHTAAVQVQTADVAQTEQPVADGEDADEQTALPLVSDVPEQAQTDEGGEGALFGEGSGRQEKLFTAPAQEQTADIAEHAPVFGEAEILPDVQAMPQTEVPQVMPYLEVQQLMNQMEGLARMFASTEGTTLEMQLNPESLGKLFLTVTEKQGAVTAQIAASNEQVKEALQTQMAELRSTLQAQGLKVEAVEVTVATHEFEQNLDGNTSANGQMGQEQAERQGAQAQGGRRNLNLNSLDELSGLMSDEEALVAQMMRDNGGTVDYIA